MEFSMRARGSVVKLETYPFYEWREGLLNRENDDDENEGFQKVPNLGCERSSDNEPGGDKC